jgi:hypothetical protein
MIEKLIKLLKDDNLVWSEDFELIRPHLAELITLVEQSSSHQFDEPIDEIAVALLTETYGE